MKINLTTTLGRLRVVGFLEGVSFLVLLLIAMPLKYIWQMPQAVQITGMAHGVLFILYILAVIQAKIELGWNMRKTLLALVASVLPFGTFYAEAKLFREEAAK